MTPTYNGIPITDMGQLQALMAAQSFPSMQAPMPPITIEQVRALIDERLKQSQLASPAAAPVAHPMMIQFEDLIQRALNPDDYKQFLAYTSDGAKDFDKMLSGDAFYPIIQLFWDTIKEQSK